MVTAEGTSARGCPCFRTAEQAKRQPPQTRALARPIQLSRVNRELRRCTTKDCTSIESTLPPPPTVTAPLPRKHCHLFRPLCLHLIPSCFSGTLRTATTTTRRRVASLRSQRGRDPEARPGLVRRAARERHRGSGRPAKGVRVSMSATRSQRNRASNASMRLPSADRSSAREAGRTWLRNSFS